MYYSHHVVGAGEGMEGGWRVREVDDEMKTERVSQHGWEKGSEVSAMKLDGQVWLLMVENAESLLRMF